MNHLRYPVVLFDVGHTLVCPRESFGRVYADVLGTLGMKLDPGGLDRCIHQVGAEISSEIPAGVDRYACFPGGEDEYWLRFSRRILERAVGAPIDDALSVRALRDLREAFRDRSAWRIYPDVLPTLHGLRESGVRLGIVSNWDSRLPDVLEMLELDAHFESIGISHIEGVEKPAPELFLRVLSRMGATPGQAIHVGDVIELDLHGAQAAGIEGRLIDRGGTAPQCESAIADLRVLLDLVG